MKTTNQKISLRGSLADEIATAIRASGNSADAREILNDYLLSKSDEFVYIPGNDSMIVGRKSDLGKYPPDW